MDKKFFIVRCDECMTISKLTLTGNAALNSEEILKELVCQNCGRGRGEKLNITQVAT